MICHHGKNRNDVCQDCLKEKQDWTELLNKILQK